MNTLTLGITSAFGFLVLLALLLFIRELWSRHKERKAIKWLWQARIDLAKEMEERNRKKYGGS